MVLNEIFENIDLQLVHGIATLSGAFLAVYVMQLWGTGEIGSEEPHIFVHMRRAALTLLALTFLWSLLYSDTKGWQPWPPHLFAIIAIDRMLFSSAISAFMRKRNGHARHAIPAK